MGILNVHPNYVLRGVLHRVDVFAGAFLLDSRPLINLSVIANKLTKSAFHSYTFRKVVNFGHAMS